MNETIPQVVECSSPTAKLIKQAIDRLLTADFKSRVDKQLVKKIVKETLEPAYKRVLEDDGPMVQVNDGEI